MDHWQVKIKEDLEINEELPVDKELQEKIYQDLGSILVVDDEDSKGYEKLLTLIESHCMSYREGGTSVKGSIKKVRRVYLMYFEHV